MIPESIDLRGARGYGCLAEQWSITVDPSILSQLLKATHSVPSDRDAGLKLSNIYRAVRAL